MDIYVEGCPIAWMISSNATEVTIDYFIKTLRAQNPTVIPAKIMSDFNKAQINVINSIILNPSFSFAGGMCFMPGNNILSSQTSRSSGSSWQIGFKSQRKPSSITTGPESRLLCLQASLNILPSTGYQFGLCGQPKNGRIALSLSSVKPICWLRRMYSCFVN